MLASLSTAILLAPAGVAAIEVQVRRSGAEPVAGTLVAIDSMSVEVAAADQTYQFPVSEVLAVSRLDEPPLVPPSMGRVMVRMTGGSHLATRRFSVLDQRVVGQLADGSSLETPLETITSILFIPLTPQQQSRWESLRETPATSDMLVVRRGGQLDFVELTVGDVTDQKIQCTLDGESLEVMRGRVVGIIYPRHREAATRPASVAVLDFTDGSRIVATAVSLTNDQFTATTSDGLELSYPAERFLGLDASSGKIARLVDRQPLLVQYAPYHPLPKSAELVKQFMQPRFLTDDNDVSLQLDGVSYDSGIVARSRTRLRYAVPSGFTRFSAIVGFIDHVRPQGLVHVRVSGDDRVLFEEAVSGNQPASAVAVELSSARQLTIEIDYGSDDDTADIVCICEARFEK